MRRGKMRTSLLVSAVVGAHCVAVGSALLIQGCGTTRGPGEMPTETPMPPSFVTEEPEVYAPTEVAPASVAPEAKTWPVDATTPYVVGMGDTLSGIASRYGVTVAEVMTINRISDPNKIRLGQKLLLPGTVDVDKPVKRTPKPAPVALAAGSNAYVVQAGDCLSVIAAKAGVKTKALAEANGIKNNKIYVGQTLAIPGGKPIASGPNTVVPSEQPVSFAPTAPVLPAVVEDELPMVDLAPEMLVPPNSATMYTVKAGDDILTVASEHNVSIADLRRVNRLSSDVFVPGQKLVIPTQD
jgi:LysM repeat protein